MNVTNPPVNEMSRALAGAFAALAPQRVTPSPSPGIAVAPTSWGPAAVERGARASGDRPLPKVPPLK